MTGHPINPKAVKWFGDRGISDETISRMGIYSGKVVKHGDGDAAEKEVVPDLAGNVICFPYFERGREVATKYRMAIRHGDRIERLFWQKKGGKKTFYNVDILDDPILERGDYPCVITEGEPDMLTAIDCGHPWAMSVPDGAPADRDAKGRPIPMQPDAELDPAKDVKFEYVFNAWEALSKVKRFVLATDADGQGQRLKDELARRLGQERCSYVAYPHQDRDVVPDFDRDGNEIKRPVKDLNEVRLYYGDDVVREVIQRAKPYPVSGLYTLDDFEERQRVLYSTGFVDLDEHIQLYEGAFRVVSGLPGSGKTATWMQVVYNAAEIHGWPAAIASFEADVRPDVLRMLRAFRIKKPRRDWGKWDIREADEFIREMFCFITRDPSGRRTDAATVEWLIDTAEKAVVRYGIKQLLIDPWNKLDHRRNPGERGDEYLGRALTSVLDFAGRAMVDTSIIAHPTKDAARSVKDGDAISLYDISDGAHWANAAQQGVIIHRKSHVDTMTQVFVQKVKFRGTGRIGDCYLQYDEHEERFALSLKSG
jgi:twinkle protein